MAEDQGTTELPVTRAEARALAKEEAEIALGKAFTAHYRRCPGCGTAIPKVYDDCPRCNLIWDDQTKEFKPKPADRPPAAPAEQETETEETESGFPQVPF